MLKSTAIRLYVIAWRLLRVCGVFFFIIWIGPYIWVGVYHYLYAKPVQPYEPPPVACGKMAGEVYEFSRLYLPFWPEYEKSPLNGSYYVEKNDCEKNIELIFLAMTWPGLGSTEDRRVYERLLDKKGLLVAVAPVVASENYLSRRRDYLIAKLPFQVAPVAAYDSSLGLYGSVDNGFSWGRKSRRIFWSEEMGVVTSMTICNWQAREPDFYACEMTFLMRGSLKVKVTMSPENLGQWYEIRRALEAFFINRKKIM